MKWMLKNEFRQPDDWHKTARHLGLQDRELKGHLHHLEKSGMVTFENGLPHLSLKGQESGQNIVRAHRLWESYQVSTMGLKEEQIHSEAERLEHTLTPDILDEVEEKLGFPKTDPHGSPIPPRRNLPAKPLISLHLKQKGKIAQQQLNHDIEGELWELGLLPETAFTLYKVEKEQVIIEVKKTKISIPAYLAQMINIQ
jgi:DtxR family Mn-dependent transcriptional regulator